MVASRILPPRHHRLRTFARFAAAAVLVALGAGVSRILPTRALPRAAARVAQPRFVLLLYGAVKQPSGTPEQAAADVEEHRAWARGVATHGHEISGEKFGLVTTVLNGSSVVSGPEPQLEGFFVVSATSAREAVDIARSCPHAVHGGLVVVRSITPT
ncbi:MAG TPA: YciI family protein [Gemmatimonadales bacterium]|nr:YciI family protein [Gemmatimonadales bacterium]